MKPGALICLAQETFTGGVTPVAKPSDKHYKLNVTYKDKAGTFIGEYQFLYR